MKRGFLKHIFKSMRLNIIVLYAILILTCIILLSSISYSIFYNIAQQQEIENIGLITEQIADSLNVYFEGVTGAINLFRSDLSLKKEIETCNEAESEERYKYIRNIRKKIGQVILYDNDIQDIIIMTDAFRFNCLDSGNNIVNYKSPLIQRILKHGSDMKKYDIKFLSVKNKEYIYGGNLEQEMLVYFPIKNISGEDTIATMIYIFDLKRIDEICEKNYIWKEYSSYLIDEKEELFYSPHSELILPDSDWNKNKDTIVLKNDQLLSYSKIESINWRVGYQIDLSQIKEQLQPIRGISFIISIIAIVLAILISTYIGYRSTKSIKELSDSMKKMGDGDFHIQVASGNSYEEIEILNKSFNKMAQEIDRLIKEVYTIKLGKQQADLEVLQSKINPHFLNNTLQAITSLAILERNDEIILVMDSLSGLFNYILYETSNMVPVSKEIEHIMYYIGIQNIRFNHAIHFKCTIEDVLVEYKIPKLLLQPIVENAIQHGFKDKLDKKNIILKGYIDNGRITFEIIDNGRGMDKAKRIELTKVLDQEQSPGDHIGLANVNKRLKLSYDEKSGIILQSKQNCYSKVKLIMGEIQEG